MPWPTPQDFVEAVQNPSSAFKDPDLRGGVAVTNPLGLPKVISGQFACVFKIESGAKTWAVRCFVRNFPDHQLRYSAISKALREAKLPYTVAFEFQAEGIRIRGQWYPIVKMEWLTGKLLGDYIAGNVTVPSTLLDIQQQIASIHVGLASRKIAHGDLQHGNIIVSGGKLFLIDYDGMFVPDLAGKGSHELGHRNYQHPFRTESDFNERMDVFSVWILCASLVVLSIDPSLWNKLNGGDDNILFRADDYKEPYKSTAFAALKSHGDHRVRELALLLESLCYVRSITDVQEFAADRLFVLLQQMPAGGVAVVGGANSSSIPSWLGRPSDIDNQLGPKKSPGSWIVDHIRFDQKTFEAPLLRYRWGIVGLPLSVLLVLGLSAFAQTNSALFIAGPSGIFAGIMLFLRNGFANDPMNKTKLEVRSARSLALHEVTTMKNKIPPKEKQIEKQRAEFETHLASIKTSSLKTVKQVAETKKKPSDEFSSRKQQAHSKRQTIDSADADERSVITMKYTGQVNMLRNQLSALDQGLQAQVASDLKTFQDEFVQNYLKGFSLNQASIPGIGEKLKERLTSCGIRTAADATYHAVLCVEGIGYQKAAAIKRWTDGILQRARNSIPTRLDLTRETQARQIRNDVEQQKRVIQTKVADLERRRDADINASKQRFQQQRYELDKGILLAEAEYQKMMSDADAAGARENAKWAQQANDATRTFNSWIADAETDLLTVRGELAKREYEHSLVERKLAAYRGITFVRWLRHQLVGG